MAKDRRRAERREVNEMFKKYKNHLKKGEYGYERPELKSRKKYREADYEREKLDGLLG